MPQIKGQLNSERNFEINRPLAILQIEFLRINHCEFEMQAVGNHYDGFIELEKIMTHTH